MKTKFFFTCLLGIAIAANAEEPAHKHESPGTNAVPNAAATGPTRWPAFKSEREKVSYAMGYDMAGFHLEHKDILDSERMVQGFRDAFDGARPMLDYADAKELMDKFEKEVQELTKRKTELEGVVNRRKGAKFLEENKVKEGVKTTASGLQYKVIKEGTGAAPKADDRIRFHYVVKNVEGALLDDSHRLPKPVNSPLRSLIKGWQEGLQMMKEGGVYEFYVPSELAYGEQGAGRNIKANETLVTQLELVTIEK